MSNHREDTNEFVPWEDEQEGKRKPYRGNIPPKTNIQSKVHSKPKTDGQGYLDMYRATKEKERTQKYGEVLAKRLRDISGTWRDLKKYLSHNEKELSEVAKGSIEGSQESRKLPRNVKTVDWNY